MKIFPITGVVGWDVNASDVRDFLRTAGGEDVQFDISSPGGLVSVGLEIFNLIRNYPGHTTAKLSGYAMSMGSYIPLACDRVVAEDNAVYMIHNARGGVWGDHNDILSYGAYVKGLSGLLGKQYVKTTGKTIEEIAGWMDKETFFFGEEMVEAGFVHELIVTGKDKDKEQNVAMAAAVFMDTMAKLGADSTKAREDVAKACQMLNLGEWPTVGHDPAPSTPAPAGENNKEVQQMALQKLLADNPAAKAQYDAALAAARTEGEAAGKKTVMDTIEAVSPYLANAEYPGIIASTALKVLKGEEGKATLVAAVAAVDAVREDAANRKAGDEGNKAGETKGQGGQPVEHKAGEVVKDQAGLDAEIARAKAQEGV